MFNNTKIYNMNYRKFYEEKTGVKLDSNFDVHHIDFNRDNNLLTNLVAIPKQLHKEYHISFNSIPSVINMNDFIPSSLNSGGFYAFDFLTNCIVNHNKNHFELIKWICYRDSLIDSSNINIYGYNYNSL